MVLFVFIMLIAAHSDYAQARVSAVTKFRTVTIVTQPGTSIWIDGVLFGKTAKDGKLEITTISAGSHTLRLRSDGFREKTQPLAAIQKGEIKVVLVKTTDEAELAFQEANRLDATDREKSANAYRKAIKLRPNYPEAYLALARTLSETGEFDAALNAIITARKLRPAYAEASAVEGRIQKENGEEGKAITAFKRAITEGRGFQPEALTGLGLLYKEKAEGFGGSGDFEQEKANYDESAKYLKMAIKQLSGAPDSVVVYQLLGLVFERQKKYDDAIATYQEFLRLFPNSTEASAVQSFIDQIKKQKIDQND